MREQIQKILEAKHKITISDLLYPDKLFHIVNPILGNTDKRYIFYSLVRKDDAVCLVHGSWKDTGEEGDPIKYYDILKGDINSEEFKNLQETAPKPKRDIEKLRYVFKQGTNVVTKYVQKKHIQMFSAVNVKGDTLVPIIRDMKFIGFQSIKPDGEKRFVVSDTIKGAYSIIEETDDNSIVYITEGFATGASVAMAIPSATVISALNLSNILRISRWVRDDHPDKIVIPCLDMPSNADVEKKNEIIKKEFTCVEPAFKGREGTDFNDLHIAFGLDEVKKQLLNLQSEKKSFKPIPMGYDEGHYFIYSQRLNDVLRFTRNSSIKSISLSLASKQFWDRNFKGDATTMREEHWNYATDAYIQMCVEKGWYDTSKVRGMGIYEDEGRYILNDGKNLYEINKKIKPISRQSIQSDARYTFSSSTIGDISKSSPLKPSELNELCEAVYSFDWAHKYNSALLLGWIVQSIYSGLSDWRAHIWIVGDPSTGKSFIKDNVFNKLIPYRRKVSGMTSPAGVLQELSPHGLPFVHEECEAEDKKSVEWIIDILKMHRVSSSSRYESIGRGTPQGTPIKYAVRHSACNISINSHLPLRQDKERFMILELISNPRSRYKKGAEFFKKISDNYYKRFLVTCLLNINLYLENYNLVLKDLEENKKFKNLTLHVRRCTASCIAGYSVLQPEIPLKKLIKKIGNMVPDYAMRNTIDTTHKEDYMHEFLTYLCPRKWNVGEGVTFLRALHEGEADELFADLGVRLTRDHKYLIMWTHSPIIKHLHIENNIIPIKSRTTDIRAFSKFPVIITKIGGKNYRCVKINIESYTLTKEE